MWLSISDDASLSADFLNGPLRMTNHNSYSCYWKALKRMELADEIIAVVMRLWRWWWWIVTCMFEYYGLCMCVSLCVYFINTKVV